MGETYLARVRDFICRFSSPSYSVSCGLILFYMPMIRALFHSLRSCEVDLRKLDLLQLPCALCPDLCGGRQPRWK